VSESSFSGTGFRAEENEGSAQVLFDANWLQNLKHLFGQSQHLEDYISLLAGPK
jgi:hypothetical protein